MITADQQLAREDRKDDVHVMPNLLEGHPHAHASSVECWCAPDLNFVDPSGPGRVWLHREVQ